MEAKNPLNVDSERPYRDTEAVPTSIGTLAKALLSALPHAAWVWDGNGTLVCANRLLTEYLGTNPPNRESLGELVHPEDREAFLEEIRSPVEVVAKSVLRLKRSDGEFRWHEVSVAPLRDFEGALALGTALDVHEQRMAHEALQKSQDLGNAVLESSPDCVKILDHQGRLLEMNGPGLCLMEIQNFEPLRGQDWWTLWPSESWPQVKAAVELARQGEIARFESYCPTAAGTPKWWEVIVAPVHGASGRVDRLLSVSRDVTERVRGDDALRSQLRITQTMAENADSPLMLLSREGFTRYANPAFYRVTGYSEEDTKGKTAHELIHYRYPDGRPFPIEECPIDNAYWDLKAARNLELTFVRKDGSLFPVVAHVAPLEDERGEMQGGVLEFRDVSEERARDQALRESEERYRKTFHHAPVGIAHVGLDGHWITFNDAIARITGYDREELVAMTFADVTHPDDLAADWAQANQLLAGEIESYWMEKRYIRKDGSVVWIDLTVSLLRDERNDPIHFIAIVEDIDERKRAQQSLLEQGHRQRFIADLVERTSDLRNPEEVMRVTIRMLGEHLEVSRCTYAEVEPDGDWIVIHDEYIDGIPSVVGRLRLSDFGERIHTMLNNGQPCIVSDVVSAPETASSASSYAAIGVRAFVAFPLVKSGRLTALMAVNHREAREWKEDEVGLLGTVTDRCWSTIERVRAERALRESEAQYRQIAEGLPEIVWSATPDGVVDFANQRTLDYFRVGLADLTQERWTEMVHPDDRQRVVLRWTYSLKSGAPYDVEFRLKRHDGQYRWFLNRAIPLRNEQGEIARWFGTCTDIHDRKLAEQALQISNDFASTIAEDLDHERIVQALTDASTQAIEAQFGAFYYGVPDESGSSPRFHALSGAPTEAIEELGLLRAEGIVRSDDLDQDPRYGPSGPRHGDVSKRRLPIASYLAVPVVSRSGEVIGGLIFGHPQPAMFTDEHERIVASFAAQASVAIDNARLYERILAMNEELEQKVSDRTADLLDANERMQGFTYHVSHDLRAPLRAIVATSRMIQEDFGAALPTQVNALLERQTEAGKKLGQLVDDLLRLSRVSRQDMVLIEVDVTDLAKDAAAEGLSTHPYSTVRIDVEDGLRAKADPRLLRLALVNLIENAVKYSPHGGLVRVGRREDGAYFVSDEGIGIEAQYLEKIFEPFQRLHRDEEFKGTGIGLANVHQVTERHGGRVWAESEPGKGTTFFFTLP